MALMVSYMVCFLKFSLLTLVQVLILIGNTRGK